jgi:hypothetical protein
MADAEVDALLDSVSEDVRALAFQARTVVRDEVPDTLEEVDASAKMIGFTFQPGTYKSLFAALTVHKAHVNLMFSDGVALSEHDTSGLLEGTGKRARHIKLRDGEDVEDPGVRVLIREAAKRIPHG